ncbi:MAG: hypothetical protein ACO1RX_12860 [Candidatus Sericytochromatia bacterium]
MRVFVLLLLGFSLNGCYALAIQSSADTPVLLNGPAVLEGRSHQVLRHFYRSLQMDYVFGMNDNQERIVNQILLEEAGPGNGIINLQIRRGFQPVDMLVGAFTLGVYTRSTLILEGDVIRWPL